MSEPLDGRRGTCNSFVLKRKTYIIRWKPNLRKCFFCRIRGFCITLSFTFFAPLATAISVLAPVNQLSLPSIAGMR
jgi:hypothetical protein